ncbi:LysR family transcriptional regulator [Vibrio gangliei]|uniref:LysR family transcriptional regulator n=1 Tax=Vibrio gangliei TaxID=2077090 RepID=UPI001472E9BF|nr:LysR family transcriptional regulator [Vibrio gangliei]
MKTELQGIRAFAALSRYHSVTAAAKALNQPKSTLSRRLAQLESELGQSLFIKQGSRLMLTRAGEVFADYCERLLMMAEESQNALQSLKQSVSGEVTILAPQSLVRGWLRKELQRFLEQHSQVNIRLLTEYRDEYLQQEPDIVLSIGEKKLTGTWRKKTLGYWQFGLYASPEYLKQHEKLTHPQQLNLHQWLPYEPEQSHSICLSNGQEHCVVMPPISRLTSDNLMMQLESISSGSGIGLLPTWTANNYLRAHPGNIEPCLTDWYSAARPIVCYFAAGVLPLRVQTLIKALNDNTPKEWLEPFNNKATRSDSNQEKYKHMRLPSTSMTLNGVS